MELKQSTDTRVPVRLRAVVDGSPLTGVTYNQVTVYIQKQSGASALKVLASSDWFEIDSVNMPGEYDLHLTATDTNTLGFLKYYVNYPGIANPYPGLLFIVANITSDVIAVIGTPSTGTVSGDIAVLGTAATTNTNTITTAISASTTTITNATNSLGTTLARVLALSYDNVVEDEQTYDSYNNMTTSRVRFYDSAAHAEAAGSAGLIYQYSITATYAGAGVCTGFMMVRVL